MLSLYRQGYSYRMISVETGYSVWSVGQCIRSKLIEMRTNSLEGYRDSHWARLEELFRAAHAVVMDDWPEKKDFSAALAILDRQARLLGLDAPKTSVSIGIPADNEAWREVIGALVKWVGQQGAVQAESSPAELPTGKDNQDGIRDAGGSPSREPEPVESKQPTWSLPQMTDEAAAVSRPATQGQQHWDEKFAV